MLNVEQKYYYTHARARATTKYGAVRGNLLRISAPQKSNAIPSYFEGVLWRWLALQPLFEKIFSGAKTVRTGSMRSALTRIG